MFAHLTALVAATVFLVVAVSLIRRETKKLKTLRKKNGGER